MRAFLFDMDGTIVDSLGDIAGAVNHVLTGYGFPAHTLEAYRQMVGEGAASLIARALPRDRAALRPEALARYKARYAMEMLLSSRAYPGIDALLRAIAVRGDRLGIVTNKPQAAAEEIAQALFPGLFGVVIGERDGQPRKPHPAPARAAAAALGASAADCLFIGDTAIDIETARAAGMRSVGVLWGFRDRLELERAGAEVVVREPADILAL